MGIDEAVETFSAELVRLLDKHAPLKQRKVIDRNLGSNPGTKSA